LLLINLILMAAQLQYHGMRTGYEIKFPRYRMSPQERWPYAEDVFIWGDWIFAIIFTVEMLIRLRLILWLCVAAGWNCLLPHCQSPPRFCECCV